MGIGEWERNLGLKIGIGVWYMVLGLGIGVEIGIEYDIQIENELEVYLSGCGNAGLVRRYSKLI